jgi:hypothetical protein
MKGAAPFAICDCDFLDRARRRLAHRRAPDRDAAHDLRQVPARMNLSKRMKTLAIAMTWMAKSEADWHAAALLLPRDALVHHRSRGKTASKIANHFGVSVALCEWRLRMTGVEIQMRRSRG